MVLNLWRLFFVTLLGYLFLSLTLEVEDELPLVTTFDGEMAILLETVAS